MMRLADLIAQFGPELRQRYAQRLLPSHHQALAALTTCRTRFAPHMLAACTGCHTQRNLPHSCGHRACPHCQHFESEAWLQRQLQALVPATYFLVTFTLPAQLRALAWAHQRVVYEALMRCAWETLKTFSQNDPKLAGTPGALAVLHTHNRQLGFHPHVHVCLPAAALNAKERLWRLHLPNFWVPFCRMSLRLLTKRYRIFASLIVLGHNDIKHGICWIVSSGPS